MCLPGVMAESYMMQEYTTSNKKHLWNSPTAAPAYVQYFFLPCYIDLMFRFDPDIIRS